MNKEIAERALQTALRNGADNCRITWLEGRSKSVSYLNGEMENLQGAISSMLRISIFTEDRFGTFTTNRTSEEELSPFIRKCIASCRMLEKDECYTMPDPASCYKGGGEDLMTADPGYDRYSPEEKRAYMQSAYAETDRHDPHLISVSQEYQESIVDQYIIDSQGLQVEESRTSFAAGCECTVRGEGDARPQNSWFEQSVRFRDLPSGIGEKACHRTFSMLGGRKIRSGKYNVVLENTVSGKMISCLTDALSGSSIYQKSSFLMDSVGKRLFPETLSIGDRPHIKGSLSASYFDTEGVATGALDLIRGGIVENYLTGTYFANKLKIKRTISDPCQLTFLADSGLGEQEILQRIGRCIFITGFNGGNSNPVTGDFSYGIEGYLFENGEMITPIKEMNISGNFLSLWRNSLYIGNDPLPSACWKVPTLAFADADISGN